MQLQQNTLSGQCNTLTTWYHSLNGSPPSSCPSDSLKMQPTDRNSRSTTYRHDTTTISNNCCTKPRFQIQNRLVQFPAWKFAYEKTLKCIGMPKVPLSCKKMRGIILYEVISEGTPSVRRQSRILREIYDNPAHVVYRAYHSVTLARGPERRPSLS